jgi:hypothetical protein
LLLQGIQTLEQSLALSLVKKALHVLLIDVNIFRNLLAVLNRRRRLGLQAYMVMRQESIGIGRVGGLGGQSTQARRRTSAECLEKLAFALVARRDYVLVQVEFPLVHLLKLLNLLLGKVGLRRRKWMPR